MKKKTLTLLLLVVVILTASLQCVGQERFTILESDANHIRLRFELGNFSIDTLRCEGELMHCITTKSIVVPNEYGQPDLPTFNRFIAIPQGATAIVNVGVTREETRNGINIAPSIGSQCENDADLPLRKDSLAYSVNAFYPETPVCTAAPQTLRGVDVIHLGVCPVQFNPVTKEVVIHRQMDIEIQFEGGNGHFGDDRLRSPYWDPILRNNILNYECLPSIDYDARMQQWSLSKPTGCEYLIVTPDNDAFFAAARELADYRLRQGILTDVIRVTETGATDMNTLRSWFHDAYDTWDIPPAAVCIIGESCADMQSCVLGYWTKHPSDQFITSDNPYADVNGDHLPDICFTRIVAQDETDLPVLVGKQMDYEYYHPVMDPFYYSHPLTAAGWQNTKWFQITIATISGYLSRNLKIPHRINAVYDGEPGTVWSTASNSNSVTSFFGPEGLNYIPSTPDQLGGWTDGTAADVIAAINAGTYLIQHRDHGWNNKWHQPNIFVSDFGGINNVDKMSFLISVNCRTGMFDANSACFTEALMRMTRDGSYAGIVGAISPTGQTYSFANDIFLWGVWDLFDPGFLPQYGPFADHADSWMPAFANVSGKYFLGTNVFPNTNEKMFTTICNTFHTHGDAFLRLFTEVPQEIVFEHDPFISCFSPFHITATPGAQIALTVVMDGQVHILATATATGQEQELVILEPITTGPIHLTMTGQNLLRHEENLWLVQLDRPFVVIDSLAMNGGGMTLDYDQTVNTSVVVVDVGLLPCDGGEVELTSESEHVTVTQAVASFGALQPNEPQLIENAPVFELGDDITDESIVPVTFTTHFGDESFSMTYDLRVLSPDITARLLDIDDDALGNGNGRLDPGEYATISFSVTNSGHLAALQPRFSLVNEEDYVMVLTPEQTLDDMEMGDTAELSFDVFVDHHAGEVPQVTLTLCSAIKGIRLRQNFYCTIGFVLESFERGLFDPEYWINDPEHPWFVVDDYAYDGNYSARSDTVTHNEASSLTLTHTAYEEGEFSFFCKVSSESNYDFLIFSIDSVEMDRWSGDVLWVEQTYDVQPGQHAYVWSYAKDYSVDGGLDAAWIDYIQLPFHPDAIEEQDDMPLTLHPNPTDGLIRIGLELAGDFTVQVFDEVGRLVLSRQNATAISLAGKPSGMYHVVVVQDGRRWSRKVVKF